MRLSFDLPSLALSHGQTVRSEVVSSDEKGSNILLNGVPTRVKEKLEAGKSIQGRIERTSGGQTVLALAAETGVTAEGAIEKFFTSLGVVPGQDDLALAQALRRHGIPLTGDWFRRVSEMMLKLGTGTGDRAALDALVLMLRFRASESGFPLLKSYVNGNMRFAALLSKLGAGEAELLKANWNAGRILDRLLEMIGETASSTKPTAELPTALVDNLVLQELLSNASQGVDEGRVYFQWPIFWEGQEFPDTLEGEAFVPPKGREDQGYSLRILVHPPSLGDMEIALHRLEKGLWVHFSTSNAESGKTLAGMFPPLQARLRELSWTSVKLTVGHLVPRTTFLGPAEPEPADNKAEDALPSSRRPFDIRA